MDAHTGTDSSGTGDIIAERDCLVGRIVDQLRSQGYYLAQLDSHAEQMLIDLRWAAQLAGRELGRKTRTYASAVGKRLPGMVTVIVAPIEEWSTAEVARRDRARVALEDLLRVHSAVNAGRTPA